MVQQGEVGHLVLAEVVVEVGEALGVVVVGVVHQLGLLLKMMNCFLHRSGVLLLLAVLLLRLQKVEFLQGCHLGLRRWLHLVGLGALLRGYVERWREWGLWHHGVDVWGG